MVRWKDNLLHGRDLYHDPISAGLLELCLDQILQPRRSNVRRFSATRLDEGSVSPPARFNTFALYQTGLSTRVSIYRLLSTLHIVVYVPSCKELPACAACRSRFDSCECTF